MKIALAQMDIEWEDKDKNLSKAENFIKKASESGCDIISFPEMFTTGFSMNVQEIGEPLSGESVKTLSGLAKDYDINIIGGVVVLPDGGNKGHNSSLVFDRNGCLLAEYIKNHPFSFANEDKFYEAGTNTGIFDVNGLLSSVFICYDLRFPELFRKVARQVQAIFVIANWPLSRKDHWETLLKARAIENQCFLIGVNRVGKDGNGIEYHGSSMIFDPSGNIPCRGGSGEHLLICEIDPEETNAVRAHYPFLRDMKD
jgi:predicted amidohydrolase